MSHGVGVTEGLRRLPDLVVLLFAFLTQLGDLWFYFLWLSVAYAYGHTLPRVGRGFDRERAAFLVALAVGGYALTETLKFAIGHPRPTGAATPPEIAWLPPVLVPIVADFATAEGHSLPSGHAVGSTVVYVGAALLVEYGRRNARYLLAGTIVAVVGLSRVVLGVHYLPDVVAGIALGLVYLAIVYRVADRGRNPVRAFAAALVVALPGAAVQFGPDTLGAVGAALGGLVGWWLVDERVTGAVVPGEPRWTLALALPVSGALVGVGYVLDSPTVAFVGFGAAILAVFAAPLVVRRVRGSDGAAAIPVG